MNLSIRTEADKDPAVIYAGGDLDAYTAPRLRTALEEVGLGKKRIIIDLSEVHFIDSTALGMLVSSLRESRDNGGEIRLVIDDPHLLKIFRITGFDCLFSIHPDMSGAIAPV